METYIGVGCHKKYSYLTVMDQKGKVVKQGHVTNTREGVKEFLAPCGVRGCSRGKPDRGQRDLRSGRAGRSVSRGMMNKGDSHDNCALA